MQGWEMQQQNTCRMLNIDNTEEEEIKNGELKTAREQIANFNGVKMPPEELKKQAENAIKKILQLYQSPKWERIYEKPCQLYAMNEEGKMIAKASAILNTTLDQMQDLIDCQKEYLPATITHNKVLKEEASYGQLRYRFGKALWPILHRDMVMVRTKRREEDRLIVAFKSVNYDIPLQPGTIRVEIHVSGFIVEKINENECRFSNLASVDPKGAVPFFLKNKMYEMQGKMPLKMKQALEKRKQIQAIKRQDPN